MKKNKTRILLPRLQQPCTTAMNTIHNRDECNDMNKFFRRKRNMHANNLFVVGEEGLHFKISCRFSLYVSFKKN